MSTFLHAIELFLNRFTEIGWHWVGLALIAHSLKTLARTRAWRNILRVTYPDARVRWRSVLGAYVAGVGVNAVVPARGGDLIKLYLVRRRIDGATYPTLATTLVVETAFDFVIAMGLLVWAVSLGVLPALNVLPGLDAFDWAWIWRHPIETGAIAGALVLVGGFLLIRGARRVGAFRRKVAQGFTVWRRPVVYFGSVVPWQALDWILRIAEIYLFLLAFGVAATVDKAMVVQVVSGVSTCCHSRRRPSAPSRPCLSSRSQAPSKLAHSWHSASERGPSLSPSTSSWVSRHRHHAENAAMAPTRRERP